MIDRIENSLPGVAVFTITALALTMNAHAATEKLLFDFQVGSNQPVWQVVNDDVMGGLSNSQFQVIGNGFAVFSGVVSLENNGGFASVRSSPSLHNLSGCGCFLVRLRGDGQRYKFTVRTEAGFEAPLYQYGFTTKRNQWEERGLGFKDFVPTLRGRTLTGVPPLNPAYVMSVGCLIADKQEGPFRLEMSWIKALP
jgi:monofunctional biosynthetic peptidoglycan transglycosylase